MILATGGRETRALSSSIALPSVNFTKAAGTGVSTMGFHSSLGFQSVKCSRNAGMLRALVRTLSVIHTSAGKVPHICEDQNSGPLDTHL